MLANTVDPDQTPHNVASDLGLHCLPMTLLRVSRKEWVNSGRGGDLKSLEFSTAVGEERLW